MSVALQTERALLDTCVFSFIHKGDTRSKPYLTYLTSKFGCLSFITVGELYAWSKIRRWGKGQIEVLENALRAYVVLPYDKDLAVAFGSIRAESHQKGRAMSNNDAWVAACALRFGCTLLTNNRRHYEHLNGITIVSLP
ncbi:MAG: type II toxin-antitoxin system VapC family toxin [SAR202 cluster bacterium]|nr:type II toxin-antitoxin system VapC family toxin [SAR202 cluster bacterium]